MDKNLNEKDLKTWAAKLESQIEHLEGELTYLNNLLTEVGFSEGIETLKVTTKELLAEKSPSFQ
ncbi:MAG: hypothetical protein QNJ27_03910 [Simkaniaceae bacterium]|nr:hypothetical protein [Simkaniaceae bacterium]